jgi:cytochrome c oxidase subunit 2
MHRRADGYRREIPRDQRRRGARLLIDGTNVNVMLVPGYISTATAHFATASERHMPCHEFCGVGHEGMWGKIKVIDKAAFEKMASDRRRLTCVE